MDQKIITLIISIVAIVATLTSSLIGHYFTAKARTASFKQLLYGKQVDLLIRIIQKQGRFKVFATLLMPGGVDYKDRAREDIGEVLKDYSILSDEAAAIVPTEIWIAIRECCQVMGNLIELSDEDKLRSVDDLIPFSAISVKVALMIRTFIGADKLSEESVALFSTKKDLQRVTDIGLFTFEEMAKAKNKETAS